MKKFRAALPALALAAAFAALLRFPQEVSAAVTEGLRLSVSVLIPSLFPFFICVNLTSALGLTGVLARVFAPVMRQMFHVSGAGCTAVLCGAAGGYPSGAQCVAALYREGQLSRAEAEYLLLFCNNAGPAFLFGAVGTVLGIGMTGCLLLWGIHLLSALVIGLVNRPKEAPNAALPPVQRANASGAVVEAVRSAGQAVLQITMFVAAFSVLARLLTMAAAHILPDGVCTVLTGMLELSGGIAALANLPIALRWKLALASFFLGFGGLCVWMQTQAVLAPAGLSGCGMLLAKLAQGLLAALITFFLAPLLPETVTASAGTLPGAFAAGLLACGGICLGWRKMRVEISPEIRYNGET
ncbi:MAG: sporulation protein [Clostridia bacterium]|nr:MAG: sporulation protein [Clostridia bacterium]